MFVPLISLILGIVIFIAFLLLYQEVSPFRSLPWLINRRKNPLLILSIGFIILSLSLGIVGYWGLINAMFLGQLRKIMIIAGAILFVLSFFGTQIFIYLQFIMQNPLLLRLKSYLYSRRNSLLVSLLLGLIAIALMAPMASSKVIFSISDSPSHIGYIVQAKMALEEGQFPIRVAPLENYGFRYAAFQFYSQLPYFLGGLIYKFITPSNPYVAYKILLWAALWLGSFFIYRLALTLTRSQVAAILAGISYMSAPYFLNNIHARGAFTESIAQGILPIVIFYVVQVFKRPTYRSIIISGLAWFALAITHIITFVFTTIFMAIAGAIFWLKVKPVNWRYYLIRVGLGYLLGWLLALYFLMPVVFESGTLAIHRQIGIINPFDTNWMTPLANLLSPTSLPSEPTELGIAPTYGLHPAVGWVFLAAWGTVAYYCFSRQSFPPRLQRSRHYILPLLSVFILALFMTWSPISIWSLLPKQLWVTQFTFRLLTHVMWSGALLVSFAVVLMFRSRLESRHLIIGILLFVIVSRPWLPAPRGTLTVEQLLKEPLFRYSGALDYLYHPHFKTIYGNAELDHLPPDWIPGYSTWDTFINHPLILEAEISYQTWQKGESPSLVLEGDVPIENIKTPSTLLVQVDGKTVGKIPLNSHELKATIPFAPVKIENSQFGLKFLVDGTTNDGKPLYIRMKKLYFEGLSPENTIMTVDQTKPLCQQEGKISVCNFAVSAATGVVQLPVLYYPRMQKVWVNGQVVKGFPANYRDFYLLGLKLSPGQYQVRVQFQGLAWANWISLLAWISTLVILSGFVKLPTLGYLKDKT